ncbi:MAG: hypothetical protein LH650_08165 [Chloroflexi bacterium]|nr:hypothetical protein [Chloroflexota bacterium]
MAAGQSLDLTSFASVFLSRYDAPIDESIISAIRAATDPDTIVELKSIIGRVSIAGAWMIARRYREFFGGAAFATLRDAGARAQRPLWAGVVARNSRYGDVTYMEAIAIPGTAITASDVPLDAYRLHGIPLPAIDDGSSDLVLDTCRAFGIDADRIAHDMEETVVIAFMEAFDGLVAGVERKAIKQSRVVLS